MRVPDLLELVILGLAAYRTTVFLILDELPFGGLREWIIGSDDGTVVGRFPPPSPVNPGGSMFGFLWTCMSCMSVWATVAWYIPWLIWPNGTLAVAAPFAIAGLARTVNHS